MNLNASESNIISGFNYRDLIIFIVPILLFSLYLFGYNPGVLTVASYSQLHQIATGQFTNAHPIFHTLLEMLCLKLFKSPFYIGLIQILIFSAMWMVICKYHRDDSLTSSNGFFIQFILTVIICLIPINAVYSITLSSSVLFSYSIMFLCFLIKVMVDRNGQIDTKLIVLMALTLAVMSGLNTYGIYIALISLIAIIFYLYRLDAPQNTFTMLAGVAIVCILLIGSLSFIYDVGSDNVNVPTSDAFGDGVNLENAKNQFFSMSNAKPVEDYENTASANLGNSKYDLVDSFVNMFRGNFILDALFDNAIVYLILSIIVLALIYTMTQSGKIFLIYVPPLINTVIGVLTGQYQLYSNILVFYLIVIIFASLILESDMKLDAVANVKRPSMPKREKIETQPAVEPETPANNTYYHDLESEIDDLTLDEINEMLKETPTDLEEKTIPQEMEEYSPEGSSDLIDEILKEIEMGKE